MDNNIEDYLETFEKSQINNVTDDYTLSKYNRNIYDYCTSTMKTSISWGTVKVTTRVESYHEKFI